MLREFEFWLRLSTSGCYARPPPTPCSHRGRLSHTLRSRCTPAIVSERHAAALVFRRFESLGPKHARHHPPIKPDEATDAGLSQPLLAAYGPKVTSPTPHAFPKVGFLAWRRRRDKHRLTWRSREKRRPSRCMHRRVVSAAPGFLQLNKWEQRRGKNVAEK